MKAIRDVLAAFLALFAIVVSAFDLWPNLNEQNIRSVGAKSLMCSARSGFVTGSRLVFTDGEVAIAIAASA